MNDTSVRARGSMPASRILGTSKAIVEALALARRLAPTDLPILLVGATGTGKELFAQEIHQWSGREGALVDVNCAALPRDLAEGVLFGHRRGAFTGAHHDAQGLLEAATRGTLFLDELNSLPRDVQPKLLRALETGEVRRLGESIKRAVHVRFLGAAHPALARQLRTGEFRHDLYQRIAGAVVRLPPLAERPEDIEVIAAAYAMRHKRVISVAASELLVSHDWPGNVRELRMVIERSASLEDSRELSSDVVRVALSMGTTAFGRESDETTEAPERARILEVFAENGWNAARTARALGLGRTTLFKELKALGISLRDIRSNAGMRASRLLDGYEL
jgi:two-component system, NtrC family, response regulator